jgi:hypothetical protein
MPRNVRRVVEATMYSYTKSGLRPRRLNADIIRRLAGVAGRPPGWLILSMVEPSLGRTLGCPKARSMRS